MTCLTHRYSICRKATLVTLTSGYIGYFIANVGLKEHHKPIEVTFSTLIFGLLSMMVYQAVMWLGLNAWLATPPALLCAFICGVLWRKYGRKWMYRFLWNHDISWSDDTSSAWQAMFDQRLQCHRSQSDSSRWFRYDVTTARQL